MHNATSTQRQMLDHDLETCCQAATQLRFPRFICCAAIDFWRLGLSMTMIGLRTVCGLGAEGDV